jgi:hypothetical protein
MRLRISALWLAGACLTPRAVGAQSHIEEAEKTRTVQALALVDQCEGRVTLNFDAPVYQELLQSELRNQGLHVIEEQVPASSSETNPVADLALEGTVTLCECRQRTTINCRVGVDWRVIEPRSGAVRYAATTFGALYKAPPKVAKLEAGSSLLAAAFASLLTRSELRTLLSSSPNEPFGTFQQVDDELPSLEPELDAARNADRVRAEAAARRESAAAQAEIGRVTAQKHVREEQVRRRPVYVSALRFGGVLLAGIGLAMAIGSAAAFDRATTQPSEYRTLRLWNDVGWTTASVGVGALGVGLFIPSPQAPLQPRTASLPSTRLPPLGVRVVARY